MKTPGQHISLWQRVNRFGVIYVSQKTQHGERSEYLRSSIIGSRVIDIANVREYIKQFPKPRYSLEDFPNLAPAFGRCLWPMGDEYDRVGLQQYAIFQDSYDAEECWESLFPDKPKNENAKYLTILTILMATSDTNFIPLLYPGNLLMQIDEAGAALGIIYFEDNARHAGFGMEVMISMCTPYFLGQSLMHCKNVSRVAHEIDEPPKAIRHNKDAAPKYRYHVLQIDPMKEVLRTEGQSETVGMKKALHICRGHFRTYSEESKGLFGRGQHGTFFIESHVRGSAKRGVVAKDYAITGLPVSQPPKEE